MEFRRNVNRALGTEPTSGTAEVVAATPEETMSRQEMQQAVTTLGSQRQAAEK